MPVILKLSCEHTYVNNWASFVALLHTSLICTTTPTWLCIYDAHYIRKEQVRGGGLTATSKRGKHALATSLNRDTK